MNHEEFLRLVDVIHRDKDIPKEEIFVGLESAIGMAVKKRLGVGEDLVHTSIRFSIGRFTTEEELMFAAEECLKSARKLREMSPLYEMVKEGIDLNTIEWKHD